MSGSQKIKSYKEEKSLNNYKNTKALIFSNTNINNKKTYC